MAFDAARLILFPALMAYAASSDLLTMTISNRVSLILIGGFFALALAVGMSGTAILMHIAAAAVVLTVAFICFAQGSVVFGDAKLAAASSLWLGFSHLLDYLLYASVFGGALTLALIYIRMVPLPRLLANQEWAMRLHQKNAGIPYGI